VTSQANPIDQPDAWDVFILSGQPSPGYCVVTGASSPRKLDEKDGHGQSGATVTYKGDKLCHFTVTVYLMETVDWDAWWLWRRLLAKPPTGAKAAALSCSHPALAPLGVDSCLVEEEGQPEPDGDDGRYKIAIKFCQFRPPTPSLGTPAGATNTDPDNPTPQSVWGAKNAALVNQIDKLADDGIKR
jgi:hypothetical protein